MIGSFVGTTAITIGYAAFSYYKTINEVAEIKGENEKIKIQIDTLKERSDFVSVELKLLKVQLDTNKIQK